MAKKRAKRGGQVGTSGNSRSPVRDRAEALRELQRKVDAGVRDIEAGRVYSVHEVMAEWKRRNEMARQRAERRKKSA